MTRMTQDSCTQEEQTKKSERVSTAGTTAGVGGRGGGAAAASAAVAGAVAAPINRGYLCYSHIAQ